MKKLFTSESVAEGHPDKLCDQISDGILDAVLSQDNMARCAIECCAAYNQILIMGEITTTAKVNYKKIARDVIAKVGYTFGNFRADNCKINLALHKQSPLSVIAWLTSSSNMRIVWHGKQDHVIRQRQLFRP